MSFKEFIKMYYKYTYKDTPKNIPDVVKMGSPRRGFTEKTRAFCICACYVTTLIFILILLAFKMWCLAILYLIIEVYYMIMVQRFGLIYYFICWYIYEHFGNSYNSLLKKYFYNKINPAIIYDTDNNKYVLDRKGPVSLLVVKFKMHKKGSNNYYNYCKVSFKFNKVVIKKKLKREIIKNKNYTEEDIINKIIGVFNSINYNL